MFVRKALVNICETINSFESDNLDWTRTKQLSGSEFLYTRIAHRLGICIEASDVIIYLIEAEFRQNIPYEISTLQSPLNNYADAERKMTVDISTFNMR